MTITWIACADRLPENDDLVLIVTGTDTGCGYYYGKRRQWHDSSGWPLDDVTHWALLPDGPQEAACATS